MFKTICPALLLFVLMVFACKGSPEQILPDGGALTDAPSKKEPCTFELDLKKYTPKGSPLVGKAFAISDEQCVVSTQDTIDSKGVITLLKKWLEKPKPPYKLQLQLKLEAVPYPGDLTFYEYAGGRLWFQSEFNGPVTSSDTLDTLKKRFDFFSFNQMRPKISIPGWKVQLATASSAIRNGEKVVFESFKDKKLSGYIEWTFAGIHAWDTNQMVCPQIPDRRLPERCYVVIETKHPFRLDFTLEFPI